jgi:hypothetical protein
VLVFTVSGMTLHVTNLSMNLRFSHCILKSKRHGSHENAPVSDLISKKAIFAVLCEDTQYDFYLVKANSESLTLNHDKTDSWDCM